MKVLYINSVCGFGSTGKIVVDQAQMNDKSLIVYGRKSNFSNFYNTYKMTNLFGNAVSVIETVLFDRHGFSNKYETRKLTRKITEFNPDIIHLHNLHGYYLNLEILFEFLTNYNRPVVWTMHDCWAFTGYCPHFDYAGCDKYKNSCDKCPLHFSYPFSIFKQNTKKNYYKKKELFDRLDKLIIVSPSKWLKEKIRESNLKNKEVVVINNGINLSLFKPTKEKNNVFSIIFVASVWTKLKGIDEIEKMIQLLDSDINITIVGSLVKPKGYIKKRCRLIERTNSINELVDLYSESHCLVNMTLEDTFPTINIEAISCGTPVITYNTGGSPEIINEESGIVVEKHNYVQMAYVINKLKENNKFKIEDVVAKSKEYSKERMLNKYKLLYENLVKK